MRTREPQFNLILLRGLLFAVVSACCLHLAKAEVPTVESSSTTYTMQSTVRIVAVSGDSQHSAKYEITSQIDKANNGIAAGSGTKMVLDWPLNADVQDGSYDVYSSQSLKPETFAKINSEPVEEPPYEAQMYANGIYYFMVYYVDSTGLLLPWTEIFAGTMKEFNSAKYWTLYP